MVKVDACAYVKAFNSDSPPFYLEFGNEKIVLS